VGRIRAHQRRIECVGTIDACPGGELPVGLPVAALMGGLGRTIPGSYAQYTVVRVANIVPMGSTSTSTSSTSTGTTITTTTTVDVQQGGDTGDSTPFGLSWADLAAIPESSSVAWTCLFRNLGLEKGHRLLIRGATSALGRAAVNLAVEAGAIATGTTRNEAKFAELRALGASEAVLEGPGLPDRLFAGKGDGDGSEGKFDRVLELVGNSTLLESLGMVKRGGMLCLAGWLGGLEPIREFRKGEVPEELCHCCGSEYPESLTT
jgi:NADPH:quinone reductase-like Zn-dependent oxidoreductase